MTTTSGSTAPIRVASASEEERVYAVLALAFVSDPASRWAWPDPHTYLTHFAAVARAFGGRAFGEGTAHVAGEFAGAALWLPPGVHSDEETMAALMAQTVPEANQADMSAVFEQMGGFHPTEPHWYLPMIGIDPVQQGRGLGSALLKHALALVDRDGATAYLESSNPKNVPLYVRHGFEVIGEVQAGNSPTIAAMLRRPR
jgi:GNAT superfamily N-acetyltransferase